MQVTVHAKEAEKLVLALGAGSWSGALILFAMGHPVAAAVLWGLLPSWFFLSLRHLRRTLAEAMNEEIDKAQQRSPGPRIRVYPGLDESLYN